MKFQVSMHYKTGQILSVCGAKGSVHDFKLFKKSLKYLTFKPYFIADKGYQGLQGMGFGCLMPIKAKKGKKICRELKKFNREINRRRICIEHVFGRLKRFRILSCVYRNRQKRLGLRFNLIAAIYNLERTNNDNFSG